MLKTLQCNKPDFSITLTPLLLQFLQYNFAIYRPHPSCTQVLGRCRFLRHSVHFKIIICAVFQFNRQIVWSVFSFHHYHDNIVLPKNCFASDNINPMFKPLVFSTCDVVMDIRHNLFIGVMYLAPVNTHAAWFCNFKSLLVR